MEILNDIINYCNDNQGFFSALLGFLAILISVLTYYNQKKEQTKNIQENARLQRELTEQNNKLQADLQIRQIKLEKYNLLIINWRNLYKLENFIIMLTKSLKVDIQSGKEAIKNKDIDINMFYYLYEKYSYEKESEVFLYNILSYFNELNFLFDKAKLQHIELIHRIVYNFYSKMTLCHYYGRNNFSTLSDEEKKTLLTNIIDLLKLLYDSINDVLKYLESEINEYNLKHIQNIERN